MLVVAIWEDGMKDNCKSRLWQTLSTRQVFEAHPWIGVYQDEVRLPSGRVVDDFYRVSLPMFVMIYAQHDNKTVLFEKKYEHAIQKVCYALPAGCIDEGEAPINAAKRELLEETGYMADKWIFVGSFYMDSNRGCGKAYFYKAYNLQKVQDPLEDDMEEISLEFAQPENIMKSLFDGNCSIANIALLAIATNPLLSDASV